MTDDPEEEQDQEDDKPNAAPPPAAQDVTPPQQRFRAATDEELDPQSFMVSDDRSALRAVLRGGSIETTRGDADFIGGAIKRLAVALRQSAERYREGKPIGNPMLRRLEFGSSVTIELEVSPDEEVVRDLNDQRHSPSIDAVRIIGELLATAPDDLVAKALPLGPDAVAAYKRFLGVLGQDHIELEWLSPNAVDVVTVTSADARHDVAILDREGARGTQRLTVPGTLTMADSELRKFALTLPKSLERPPLLKGKHRVQGTFSEEMGVHLREAGLWDSDVTATIAITFDVAGSTPTPREPQFELVQAEALRSDDSLF